MKKSVMLSVFAMLFAIAYGCDKNSTEPTPPEVKATSLTLSPTELTLIVGESQRLEATVTPKGVDYTIVYSSDNPEVAIVDDRGIVTAVAEGDATISANVDELTATAKVIVKPEPRQQSQQMPILKFDAEKDPSTGAITDPKILEYEANLGRNVQDIEYQSGTTFPGFVNTDLSVIPAVIYGIEIESTADVILCYSKETIEDPVQTQAMLRELGFETFEKVTVRVGDDGEKVPGFRSRHSTNKELSLIMRQDHSHKEDFGTNILIEIALHTFIPTAHDIIVTAKDFPSVEALISEDFEQIRSFEEDLGLRALDEKEAGDDMTQNPRFVTKSDAMGRSNLNFAIYVNFSFLSDIEFLNTEACCVKGYEDLFSEEFKAYLAENGFDKDYGIVNESVVVYNDRGDLCQAFINLMFNTCYIQICPVEYTSALVSFSKMPTQRSVQMGNISAEYLAIPYMSLL